MLGCDIVRIALIAKRPVLTAVIQKLNAEG
jgi:hypothetical protein